MTQKLTGASESASPSIGLKAGIDAFFTLEKIKPFMFGVGTDPYVPRKVEGAYAWNEGCFGFIPFYVIVVLYHDINDNSRLYLPVRFGYSIFYADDAFTNLGRYGGSFKELGVGIKYKSVCAEICYTMINSTISGRELDYYYGSWYTRESDLKYKTISISLGVSF